MESKTLVGLHPQGRYFEQCFILCMSAFQGQSVARLLRNTNGGKKHWHREKTSLQNRSPKSPLGVARPTDKCTVSLHSTLSPRRRGGRQLVPPSHEYLNGTSIKTFARSLVLINLLYFCTIMTPTSSAVCLLHRKARCQEIQAMQGKHQWMRVAHSHILYYFIFIT